MARDYYAILGVGAGAPPAQIRRAYQRLARQYSPDVNLWDRGAKDLFEEIAEAYRVLSDPTTRALYDRHGSPPGQRGARRARGSGPLPGGGRRGDDLHVPVELAFTEAVTGLATDLTVERLSPCEICKASGAEPDAHAVGCRHCGSTGVVFSDPGRPEPCPACEGAGERVSEPCRACHGRGVRPVAAVVPVVIPAGVDSGAQLRVPDEGHAGPFGGPRGDLIVITRVNEDPVFTRKGDNLHCDLPITLMEAVLGARIPVATLLGVVELVIPPGTQSGQIFRMRAKGMPRLTRDGRGDLYLSVKIEIPRGLDARTQALFRELERLLPDRPEAAIRRSARA